MSYNYKNYRTALQTASAPIIPYLGLFPKDITTLEESPTVLPGELVNFGKLRDLWAIIHQMSKYVSIKYRVEKDPVLFTYFHNLKPFPEKKLMELSDTHEPRRRKPENDSLRGKADTETTPTKEESKATNNRATRRLNPDEVDEYKRTQIERYEQQQVESKKFLDLRQQIAKPTKDDGLLDSGENLGYDTGTLSLDSKLLQADLESTVVITSEKDSKPMTGTQRLLISF